jgi:hypothetical protein
MAKWWLFNRSKGEVHIDAERITDYMQKSEERPVLTATKEGSEEMLNKEYNQTLHSKGSGQKQSATISEKRHLMRRTTWENAETIECNVDDMGRRQLVSPGSNSDTGYDIENKVDIILLKKKKRF